MKVGVGAGFSTRLGFFATALAAFALAAILPGVAGAEAEVGSHGSGAGQTDEPLGLAVDYTEELLYVADSGNYRVGVFDASTGAFVRAFGWGVADGESEELQTCTATCFQGIPGSGAGQFERLGGIAVDNDPGSPAFGEVYVFGRDDPRVQRFTPGGEFVWMIGGGVNKTTGEDLCTQASGDSCGAAEEGDADGEFHRLPVAGAGVAVGPGGVLHVHDRIGFGATGETRVQRYEPSGEHVGTLLLPVAGGAGRAAATAVDAEGRLYLGTTGAQGALRVYDAGGTELFSVVDPSLTINAVALDPESGKFWVSERADVPKILEFDSSGTHLGTFYGSLRRTPAFGLALFSTGEGDLFAAEGGSSDYDSRLLHISFPPPGPLIPKGAENTAATEIGSVKATLNGRVNPQKKATTFHFDYISDADYLAAGETFGAGTMSTPETALPGEADLELHDAEAEITKLFPETVYHFRVVATNPDGGPRESPTASFETREPIEFGAVWSAEVGSDRAALHVEADPVGLAATARFQYVELASFEESGFAEALEAPAAGAEPLDLGEGEGIVERFAQIFSLAPDTRYRFRVVAQNQCEPEPAPLCEFIGPEASFKTFGPPTGKLTGCPNDGFRLGVAGFLPDCRAYEMVSPVDKNGANVEAVANVNGFPAALDQAATDGDSITYSTYKAFGEVASAPYTNQYLARRGAEGWSSEPISPPREGPSIMTYASVHLDRQYKLFGEDLCDSWVVQDANPVLAEGGIPEYAGLYRRENCGPGLGSYEAITRVEAPITDPKLENRQFIPEIQGTSADGKVAIFAVEANLTSDAPKQPAGCEKSVTCEDRLYEAREGKLTLVCILPDESVHKGSCTAGTRGANTGERSGSMSNAISSDGSRIFWSDSAGIAGGNLYVRIDGVETIQVTAETAKFRAAAADGSKVVYSVGKDLFEYDVDAKAETKIAGEVEGVAGASEDASRVYLTSEEELAAGAVAGEPNLYLYEAGSGFSLVAVLRSSDNVPGFHPANVPANLRGSRITPDGEQIAFIWGGSLTGYDNLDANSGEKDQEVFLYDASAAEGAGELRCVSCNPSGARPAGAPIGEKPVEGTWAAAWFPAWESQLYGQRVLSDDGKRLYFNSFEALVPRDVNGEADVYQWEAAGTGSCSAEAPSYNDDAAGCVDLISSGQSTEGSKLVDISADGENVFFKTESSFASSDRGLIDVYNARGGGGFPEPPPQPAECEGVAGQSPAPAPEAETPSSRNVGPGNPPYVKPAKGRACPKGKRKVRRKGKVRCVKKKVRRSHRVHRRVHPNRRAGR